MEKLHKHQQLSDEQMREQEEEKAFAEMMHEFAIRQGEKYIEENERLKNDPSSAVPERVQRRCLETIYKEFRRKARKEWLIQLARDAGRVAVAACLGLALAGSAIAVSPSVRAGVMNFCLRIEERAATMQLVPDTSIGPTESLLAPGVILTWLPDGYIAGIPDLNNLRTTVTCKDGADNNIQVVVFRDANTTQNLDIEDADSYEEVYVLTDKALLVKKAGLSRLSWVDSDYEIFLYIEASGIDDADLIKIAEGVEVSP